MLYTSLDTGWSYRHLNTNDSFTAVSIPHDAMLCENRSIKSEGGINTGWFEGYDYEYIRDLNIDSLTIGSHLELEFEGVYHNAEVYLNDNLVGKRPYGYTNFYIDITDKVKQGTNKLRVIAHNSDQPNSRWYSGSGIYRNVGLWSAKDNYIIQNGITIKTLDIKQKVIEVKSQTTSEGSINLTVADKDGNIIKQYDDTITAKDKLGDIYEKKMYLNLDKANLWSMENPELYTLHADFLNDSLEVKFGVRSIEFGKNGFLLNGKREIIRGACIHHDNGILGAIADPDAILRKVQILKENGYNALRSAHNPCSKTLLDVCDSLGVLVMDEYIDHWYIHKTQFDYVDYFMEYYKQDIFDMVQKDKNHPCVILYSTGNEVSETAQKRGIALTQEMTDYIHSLDDTRPVTCGVNIFFNFLSSIGFGVYSDKNAKKEAEKAAKRKEENQGVTKKKAVGSQFFNNMAGLFGADFMKTGATLKGCDIKTRDAFKAMDVAGYNYGIKRYKKDLRHYENRLILGSETFCSDAYKYYKLVQENPRLVGDFVWAGMDYIGEVGVGAWEYHDYAPSFDHGPYWLTAGSGRIDITGKPLGEALYTQVAFNQKTGPYLAVRPVYKKERKHSPSAWKMTDAMQSWSFDGLEGCKTTVEVYARAYRIELYLNDKKIGSKKLTNDCRALFNVKYYNGELVAKAFDKKGNLIGTDTLVTAKNETVLTALPEKQSAKQGHLVYVRFKYTDKDGVIQSLKKGTIKLEVTGGTLAGFGNGCSYNTKGYTTAQSDTYYGECVAAIRADCSQTDTNCSITVKASDGEFTTQIVIPVTK